MAHHLLIADDEEGVLAVLQDLFTGQGYEVSSAKTGEQALGILKEAHVDLIIADYLMPDMNGIELLKRASQVRPDAIRILLTGHGSLQIAMEAINEANVYRFMSKPWHNRDLLLSVQRALEHHDLIDQQQVFAETLEMMVEENTEELGRLREALKEMAEKIRALAP